SYTNKLFIIQKTDASTHTVTFHAPTAILVDGATLTDSITLSHQYELVVVSYGKAQDPVSLTNYGKWMVLAHIKPSSTASSGSGYTIATQPAAPQTGIVPPIPAAGTSVQGSLTEVSMSDYPYYLCAG